MFQLSEKEFENLQSQIVISSWGGLRLEGCLAKNILTVQLILPAPLNAFEPLFNWGIKKTQLNLRPRNFS